MNATGPWHTEDFESLSWHDAHVHGFRLDKFVDDQGTADLILDIDFILQWHRSGNAFQFTVCKAELRFHDVFGLKLSLDYAAATAGMCPFMVDGIEREPVMLRGGGQSFRWRLPITFPPGTLEFQAPRFTQTLIGEPRVVPRQWLEPGER